MLRMWNWRLGREEACLSHLAGQSPASTPWLCCCPRPISDTEVWEAGCCDASEAALSTQGKCSAARSLSKQAKWLVMPEVVKLLVWYRREVGASCLSEDKPLRGRHNHGCWSRRWCGAPVPLLPQGLALPGRRQRLQSAEGKLSINPPPSPLPPGRRVGVRRVVRWCTTLQARPGAALHLQQLQRGWGVNLLPRPPCR